MRIGILITHAIPPNSPPPPPPSTLSREFALADPRLSASRPYVIKRRSPPLSPRRSPSPCLLPRVPPRRARGGYAVLTCRGGVNTTAERIPLVPSSGDTSLEDLRPKSRARARADPSVALETHSLGNLRASIAE